MKIFKLIKWILIGAVKIRWRMQDIEINNKICKSYFVITYNTKDRWDTIPLKIFLGYMKEKNFEIISVKNYNELS